MHKPRNRGLFIGNADYKIGSLAYPINDANEVAALLSTNGDGSKNFYARVLTSDDHHIGRALLLEATEQLFNGTTDNALWFFSGHGGYTRSGNYFITSDASNSSEGVSMEEVCKLAAASNAKNKIIIADCCNAGALGSFTWTNMKADLLNEGMIILASCGYKETTTESNRLKHGVFTYHLLNGLMGEAADNNGNITIVTLNDYISTMITAWDESPVLKMSIKGSSPIIRSMANSLVV